MIHPESKNCTPAYGHLLVAYGGVPHHSEMCLRPFIGGFVCPCRPRKRGAWGNKSHAKGLIAHHQAHQHFIALTVPCGNVLKTGESSRALILTVAPPNPTTTYLFLEAAAPDRMGTRVTVHGGA